MANIKDIAVPLRTLNPDDEDRSDLAPIRKLIGDARVVSAGEAAHGTGQFHDLRQRILRFLVTELGFTAYCTEFPFDEGVAVNEWIHGGPGTVDNVTHRGAHLPFGEGKEARAHLEWMRSWNAKNGNKLSFYGLDTAGSPSSAARACAARIPSEPGDAELLQLADLGGPFTGIAKLMGMPEADRARLDKGLVNLVARAKASGDEIAVRCALEAVATVGSTINRTGAPSAGGGLNDREEYMADNVAWVLKRERRIMIGAHNTHIRLDAPAPLQASLGQLLKTQLPEPPVTIGTTYGEGAVWLVQNLTLPPSEWKVAMADLNPPANTIDAMMSQVGLPLYFADLSRVSDEQLATATHELVFHDPWPVHVRQAFDAIIHVHYARTTDESLEGARKMFSPG